MNYRCERFHTARHFVSNIESHLPFVFFVRLLAARNDIIFIFTLFEFAVDERLSLTQFSSFQGSPNATSFRY